MSCFPCFQKKDEEEETTNVANVPIAEPTDFVPPSPAHNKSAPDPSGHNETEDETENTSVKSFTFRELATATKNFRSECLLGEGGFGRVFKATLQPSGQVVAVRQLDRNGMQAGKDFVIEVSTLCFLQNRYLARIIGYCADGDQRLLVYEYMSMGSLKNHLFDLPAGKKPLDWSARMKIALGIAEGLEYLHEKADPPIIYRDMKSSNILLDDASNPKLSEYGLAQLMQSGNKMHVAGYGYAAPEYETKGELTLKSDVYSFGVVLLELITGRKALDTDRPADEQNVVTWAQPIFRDPSKFPDMADPLLRKQFPVTSLNQAVGVAAMCLQEEPMARPLISDISAALSFLAMAPPEAPIPDRLAPILSSRVNTSREYNSVSMRESSVSSGHKLEEDSSSDSEDEDSKMHSDNDNNKDKEEEKSSSDYEYGDSSGSSDYEECSDDKNQADKPQLKTDASKKLNSSSKCRSEKKSVRIRSRASSRKCSQTSRISSRDRSAGSSLRQDSHSTSSETNMAPESKQVVIQESHDQYESSSSSDDEESCNDNVGSSSQSRSHTTSLHMNSRSCSHEDLHDDESSDD